MRIESPAVIDEKTRGLHGYTHEFVSTLTETQQRDVLARSVSVLTEFTGKKPIGWTAPAWDTSKQTIKLLEEFGIVSPPSKIACKITIF
jgi:peptidoglycan/xylan/chitin deacetylase (PgdA/CDA1 family)